MGLIAHYPFDGDAKDAVGEYDGTSNGTIAWVDGKLGQAADFDGSSGYVSDARISDYLHGRPEASIALWVKKDAIQYGFLQLSGYADLNGNLYPYQTETKVYLDIFRTNRLGPIYMPKSVLEWHHVVITQAPGEWKLYQDGELVHSAGADDQVSTDYLQFEIGRNSADRYADGKFHDVRIYDHALSPREVRDLSLGLAAHYRFDGDFFDSARYGLAAPVGDVTFDQGVSGKCAVFSSTGNRVDIAPVSCDSATLSFWYKRDDTVAADNWRTAFGCADNIHHAIFSSGRTFGIFDGSFKSSGVTVPEDGEFHHCVIVLPGDGTAEFFYDGESAGTTSTTLSLATDPITRIGDWKGSYWIGFLDDPRIYATALTAPQVKELYQQRASIDNEGSVYSSEIYETGYKPIIGPSYEVWTPGTTGSEPGFSRNGSAEKSSRVTDTGPHGESATLWQADNTDTDSTNDGGWNGSNFPIDNTKRYRFSVWIRRKVIGNGSGYWGTHGYGSVNGVLTMGGANTTNPYFWSGGIGHTDWFLVVGHVHPAGYTGGEHADTGLYYQDGSSAGGASDFVWRPETTTAHHRSYLFYSTDLTTQQQMAYPRVDVCDGTEPTIQQLVDGFDIRWSQNGFPKELSVRGQLMLPRSSEVGVTRGLVAWYPLIGDTLDYAGTNHAVNNGAVATAEGYEFDGTATLDCGTAIPTSGPQEWSVSAVLRMVDTSPGSQVLVNFNKGVKLTHSNSNTKPLIYLNSGDNDSYAYGDSVLPTGQVIHLTAVVDQEALLCRFYLDGVEYGTSGNWQETDEPLGIPATTVIGDNVVAVVSDLRIHNVALTPEEVATQAKLALSNANRTAFTANCMYTSGQIKEVTA